MSQPRIQLWRCNACGANYPREEWNFRRGKCNWCTKNKFNAKKVSDDGYIFDSKAEHRRYCDLRSLVQKGEITNLEVHPVYLLEVNDIRIAKYTADFRYRAVEIDDVVVEDVKSEITRKKRDYRLTIKLMWAVYRIRVTEVLY